MDIPDAQEVCRTCLRSTNTESSLLSLSDCCTPQKTYGQILEDYAQFEFKEEQEAKLPQVLCALCCRQLKRVHTFITRAQICNLQLMEIAVGSNQLDCLREEVIDLPIKVDGDDLSDCGEELTENENDNVSKGYNVKYELIPDGYCSNGEECPAVDLTEYEKDNSRSTTEQRGKEHHPHSQNSSKVFYDQNTDQNSMKSTCPICSKVLKRRMYMLNHLRKVHHINKAGNFLKKLVGKQKNNQVFEISKCTQCGYMAKNSAALTYHSRTRHATESDKYKCKFCSFESLKRWALVGHIKNEHKLEFKTLKRAVEKKQHISEHGGSDSGSRSSSAEELNLEDSSDDDGFIRAMIKEERRVIRSKYVDGEPYNSLARKCEDCGKVYKNFQSLYAHKRFVHISEDMYSVCLHCGKKYKRSQDLKNHILQSHTNVDSSSSGAVQIPEVQGKRFMCTECPYATTTTTHLKIHIRRHHTGEKPYVCEICGNSFLTLYCLKKHSYLHTGEKPHKCPYCPKTFRIGAKLKKHTRVHTGERPYKCTECGKGFTQDYNLSVHKRIHNKNRNISLPVVM